jgi:phospholipase C
VRSLIKAPSLLGSVALLAACSGGSSSSPAPSLQAPALASERSVLSGAMASKIKHVVIIFQENRSPDNLFHGLPGADIANAGLDSQGNTIVLHEIPMVEEYDLGHDHPGFVSAYDDGKMDGANLGRVICQIPQPTCGIPANPQYAYVAPSDVPEYFTMAEQYVFGDRMFQTNQGPSYPAHQFIVSGTSAPTAKSDLFVSENPLIEAGCTAPSNATVALIDPEGNESQTTYPCFEHQTLMDLLDAHAQSWTYYSNQGDSIWNAPNSIKHIRFGPDWQNVIIPETKVLKDIPNGKLAAVTWVNPNAPVSDHPGITNGKGPAWVASIVNAIGQSPFWDSTAIFITWDDWGGWYDHVAPKIYNSYEYGFRVPLIVVSPYAKKGYVSHVTHDFGSLLKFTEKTFGLGTLGYADARADDLSDCFNFEQAPRPFHAISTSIDADYLISHRGPSLPVDDY